MRKCGNWSRFRQRLSGGVGTRRRALKRMAACAHDAFALLESRTLMSGASPLTAIPPLSSNPAASATLYLDFDGDPASTWFIAQVPDTPAYDQDGDASSFSAGELTNI